MSFLRLVLLEVWHRKLTFLVACLMIGVAVAYAVSSLVLIQAHQARTQQRVATLDDEIRKITKNMGFNINILPSQQNLADFHANDFAEKTMPQEYVHRLAESTFVKSVRHLRPALIQKIDWPEYNRQVILMGVSGVVPLTHVSNPKKPLEEAVPPGTMKLGGLLAAELNLKAGDEVDFNGQRLKINQVYPERGSKDDITVWTDLKLAQGILNLPDRVNLIQALECNCASIDRLAEIRSEIAQVLGSDVQVIELATQAIARAEARETVKAEGETTLVRMQDRAAMQLGLLAVAGAVLVAMFALANVRERRSEIGILRAIGTSTMGIMRLFLCKAFLVGLVGAALGVALGLWIGVWLDARDQAGSVLSLTTLFDEPMSATFTWPTLAAFLVATPLISVLASWLPAVLASGVDPADILSAD